MALTKTTIKWVVDGATVIIDGGTPIEVTGKEYIAQLTTGDHTCVITQNGKTIYNETLHVPKALEDVVNEEIAAKGLSTSTELQTAIDNAIDNSKGYIDIHSFSSDRKTLTLSPVNKDYTPKATKIKAITDDGNSTIKDIDGITSMTFTLDSKIDKLQILAGNNKILDEIDLKFMISIPSIVPANYITIKKVRKYIENNSAYISVQTEVDARYKDTTRLVYTSEGEKFLEYYNETAIIYSENGGTIYEAIKVFDESGNLLEEINLNLLLEYPEKTCPIPEISSLTHNRVELKGLDNSVKYTLKNLDSNLGSGTLLDPTNGVLKTGVLGGKHYLLKTEDGTEIVKFITPERTSVIRTNVTIGVAGGYISSGYDSSAFYSIAISAYTTEDNTINRDPGMRIDGASQSTGALRQLNLENYKPDSSGAFEFKNLSNSVELKISKLMIIKN